MLAKALAKQSGCFFLNISTSSILSKWLGDASRLVRAVFTLAEVRAWYSWCGVKAQGLVIGVGRNGCGAHERRGLGETLVQFQAEARAWLLVWGVKAQGLVIAVGRGT